MSWYQVILRWSPYGDTGPTRTSIRQLMATDRASAVRTMLDVCPYAAWVVSLEVIRLDIPVVDPVPLLVGR